MRIGEEEGRRGADPDKESKLKPWALAICFLVISPIFFLTFGEVGGDEGRGGEEGWWRGERGRLGEVGGEEGMKSSKSNPFALAICFLVISPIFFLFSGGGGERGRMGEVEGGGEGAGEERRGEGGTGEEVMEE